MLDDAGTSPPIEDTPNQVPNPLVPLPMPAEDVVRNLDAVVITHLHEDHFDEAAARLLPRDVPVFCQPEDETSLVERGLLVQPVATAVDWDSLSITRTGGQHGTGEIALALAPVSGFVFGDLYIAGDTIWCKEVEEAIASHRPRVAVVNGSGARFLEGDPIVMTTDDIREVVARVPKVVVVHLEAINHCLDSREDVRTAVPEALVPGDGETLEV